MGSPNDLATANSITHMVDSSVALTVKDNSPCDDDILLPTATDGKPPEEVASTSKSFAFPLEIVEQIVDELPLPEIVNCMCVDRTFYRAALKHLFERVTLFKGHRGPISSVLTEHSDQLNVTKIVYVHPHPEEDCKQSDWDGIKTNLRPFYTVMYSNEDEAEWYGVGVVKKGPDASLATVAAASTEPPPTVEGTSAEQTPTFEAIAAEQTPPPAVEATTDGQTAPPTVEATTAETSAPAVEPSTGEPPILVHKCDAVHELQVKTLIYRAPTLALDVRPNFFLDRTPVNLSPQCEQLVQVLLPHHLRFWDSHGMRLPREAFDSSLSPGCGSGTPERLVWIFWTPGPQDTPLLQDQPDQATFWLYVLPIFQIFALKASSLLIVNADSIFKPQDGHCDCPHWCHGVLHYLEQFGLLDQFKRLQKRIGFISMQEMLCDFPWKAWLNCNEVTGWVDLMQKDYEEAEEAARVKVTSAKRNKKNKKRANKKKSTRAAIANAL